MTFTQAELALLERTAIQAVRAAGKKIESADRQSLAIETKNAAMSEAAQVVTELDRQCEHLIHESLEESITVFDLGWLAEESVTESEGAGDSRFSKRAFWCVDPLDGTLAYLQQQPGYAVSIALVSQQGEPLLGAVFDPTNQKVYSSSQLPVEGEKDGNLHFYTDQSFLKSSAFKNCRKQFELLAKRLGYQGLILHSQFGAVMNACSVLTNYDAFYLKLPKKAQGGGAVWDFAATAALFNAANKPVCDAAGNELNLNPKASLYYNKTGVLFTGHERLQQEILTLING